MKKRFILIAILLNFTISRAQIEPKLDFTERTSLLLEFLYAQDFALEWLQENRPDLKLRAIDAQQDFKRIFSHAINKNLPLKNIIISPESIEIIHDTLDVYIKDTSNHREYINIVRARSKGLIESPILETLLYYEYLGEPEREISDGFYHTYSMYVNDRTELIYRVPKSWRQIDSPLEKQNSIRARYRSADGYGDEIIYISMSKFDADTNEYKSKLYQKLVYNKITAKGIVAKDKCGKFFYHKNIKIGDLPGLIFKSMKCKTIGTKLQYEMSLSQYWTYQDINFLITYTAMNSEQGVKLENQFEQYEKLFFKLSKEFRVKIK